MPTSLTNGAEAPEQAKVPKKLVLCFDGTGNTFTGSNSDTNVVKILSKLDRNDPHQYHYYQSKYKFYVLVQLLTKMTSSWYRHI